MSWWNTSNITDLASKALKNAQKKIDKALDIGEGEAASKEQGAEGEVKEKKADSWSNWMPDSSSGSDGASGSAWSFPWAGNEEGGEQATGGSLATEKTAEEIKAEVLKAAKERTKAKSKLFPPKEKDNTSIDNLSSVSKDSSPEPAPQDSTLTSVVKQRSPEPVVDAIDTSTTPDNVSKESFSDDTHKVDAKSRLEKEAESTETVKIADIDKHDTESPVVSSEDHKSSIVVAELDVSAQEGNTELTTLDIPETDNVMTSSGFQEINESEANIPVTIDHSQADSSIGSDDTQVVDVKEPSTSSQPDTDIPPEKHMKESETVEVGPVTVESENARHIDIVEKDTESEDGKYITEASPEEAISDSDKEQSATDISSSVEIVSKIDTAEAMMEETVYFSGSDPELLECEKVSSDEDIVQVSQSEVCGNPTEAESTEAVEISEADLQQDSEEQACDIAGIMDDKDQIESESLETPVVISEESILSAQKELAGMDLVNKLRNSDSESSVNRLDSSVETCTSEETLIEQGSSQGETDENSPQLVDDKLYQLKQDDTCVDDDPDKHVLPVSVGEEGNTNSLELFCDTEAKSDEDSDNFVHKAEISPAHSFVKCMLEDAIDEGKHDDSSDSHSAGKSDGSRSIYSNHESSDEIDTTTSSDIEIISLPTPNGDSRLVSPLDPIPLRMALQNTKMRGSPTHRRTDSSDSSTTSRDGNCGEHSPEYTQFHRSHSEHSEGARGVSELPALDEEDDNPYHPQRLLKADLDPELAHDIGSEGHTTSPDLDDVSHDLDEMSHDSAHVATNLTQSDFEQKLAEMSEILQAREEKLLTLSKDNCDLMETNSIIRNQLKQCEEARESDMTDVNELTAEFTHRLTDAEKRVSSAIREKDILKKQLLECQGELAKRAGDVSLKEILAEKEEMIAGLLQEGEKLSKSQLQSNTIIKKLRNKEKDNESTITTQKKKVDTQKDELDHLHKVLESKEELEKKQTEAIAQLTSAVKKQEQEMVKLKSEHEDATEKARGLQVALDKSYKEMSELHRTSAAQDSKAQEAALSAETHVREELKLTIEKQQQQHKWDMDSLLIQIEDHRHSMARQEKEYNRREDLLKQEIGDLQKRLQEDEDRSQELTQGVSLATRPLLRQIENLQSTYNAQSATWERVERNLSERLSETQNQLAIATEKERSANEQLMELNTKVTSLETQNSRLRQEKSQMTAQLEMLKTKVEVSEDAKERDAAQVEVFRQQISQELQELKKQKVLLETQLDMEKSKVEQEKKKIFMLQEQIKDMERESQRSKSGGTPVQTTPVSISRHDSMVGSLHEQSFSAITQEELDRSFMLSSPNGNKQSLYEALRQSGAANLLENLQSQLKLRDGEILQLQDEIRSLERTRESMAKELVDLSNMNDDLEQKLTDLPHIQEQLKETDQRYNALLQMYGEKVEETNELKLDLQDVKDMYKAQINHLLGQT